MGSSLGVSAIAEPAPERSPADGLLEIGWLLVATLVPLAINLWAKQPFEPIKVALLRSLAWTMTALWLIDSVRAGRVPWRELRRNRLIWPVLAVLATQIVATVAAIDSRLSLYGSYERAQGTLTLLSYTLLFIVVAARLRTLTQVRRLVTTMVATAVPIVALGLLQALGWDPIGLLSDARSPVYTTLGRSNFTGAYLAMLVPLTVALAWTAPLKWQRLAGLGLLAGELAVIGLTLARGAWLATGVALATLGVLWFWPGLNRLWRILVAGGVLAASAGGLAGVMWLGGQGGSTAARLAIWRGTLELIARRPVFGYGPEALGLVFPAVYPPQLVYYQGRGILVDRAHNLFLDRFVTTGGLGLLASVALLVAFLVVGWLAVQQARTRAHRALLAACIAAVVGNIAGDLVSFDVTATAATTWLLLAVVGGEQAQPAARPSPLVRHGIKWWPIMVAILLAAGTAGAIVQLNVRPLAADISARAADRRSAAGDWIGGMAVQEQAVALWAIEPVHHQALSWSYLQRATESTGNPLPWLERAEAELLAARDLRPGDYRTWAALGELYSAWGNRWDGAKLTLAENAYRQATGLAPNHAILYTAWGMVYQDAGRFAESSAKFWQAVDLDATDAYAYAHLGDAELALGRVREALAAYREAVHWQPELIAAYLGLARCYWQLGLPEAAQNALAYALQIDPRNAAVLALYDELNRGP